MSKAIIATSLEIADKVSIQHRSVIQTIRRYMCIFEGIAPLIVKQKPTKGRPLVIYCFTDPKQLSFLANRLSSKADIAQLAGFINSDVVVYEREENSLFKRLALIAKSFSNHLDLKQDVYLAGYRLDMVLYYKGEIELIIEYDEKAHKYNIEGDLIREKEIMWEIIKDDEEGLLGCYFLRIKEGNENKGVGTFITYINNLQHLSADEGKYQKEYEKMLKRAQDIEAQLFEN